MSPPLTFLDLPPELRLKVYNLTCHTDIDCPVLQDIEHTCDARHGTQARLIAYPDVNLKQHIVWLNLSMTCRAVASDLKTLFSQASFLAGADNRTYVLDMNVCEEGVKNPARQLVWRRIPCAPELVQRLVVNVSAGKGKSPWTDGGPASMARAIYQVLNHFCHEGPHLTRERALVEPIRIRDLNVNVDIGSIMSPPRAQCNVDPRWNYALLLSGFEQISRMGYLFGYVANINISGAGELAEQAFMVDALGVQSVPGAWKNYGFSWGV